MTKNQREFQKQVNRIQNELSKLTSKGKFTQVTPIPEQPKRVTRKVLTQLESINARHLVAPITPTVKRKKLQDQPATRKHAEEYQPHPRLRFGETEKRKYKRKSKSTEPSARKITQGKTRKGTTIPKREYTDEEKARINAKRQRTLKINKEFGIKRKVRKDKGTHLTEEERLKRNAKRNETLAKKNAQYAMSHETPAETEYDMVTDIIERLEKAWNTIDEEHDYLFNLRDGYLQELLQLMHDNIDQNEYYLTLKGREEEIQNEIDGVVWGSTQPIVDGSYQSLLSLLMPKDVLLPDLKAIAEEGESIKAINHTVEDGYYG